MDTSRRHHTEVELFAIAANLDLDNVQPVIVCDAACGVKPNLVFHASIKPNGVQTEREWVAQHDLFS
jgi:hypothetical protein